MQIDYAIPMTKNEVDKFFNDLEQTRIKDYQKSRSIFERYKEQLIAEHEYYDRHYAALLAEVLEKRSNASQLKEQKKCICGSAIRYISDFGFWGCSNYNNREVEHFNFEEREIDRYYPFPVPSGWIADIRTKIGFPKSLRTGHILMFYLENGREDLLLKYNGIDSKDVVYKLSDTKRRATDFEKEQYEIIKPQLDKCQLQFAVRYKFTGFKEKFAFIDILGSDQNNVYIYECKTSPKDVNICQRDEYIDIVNKILQDLNIQKQLQFQFIFERED